MIPYIAPKHIIKAGKEAGEMPAEPVGLMLSFVGDTIPAGWMEADGRVLFVKDYPELASVIGGGYMDTVYTKEVKRWWIFSWTIYKPLDLVKEYGIFRLPKIWNARFTTWEASSVK